MIYDVPSVSDLILYGLEVGLFGAEEAKRYFRNYEYFVVNRIEIREMYVGKWVASLNRQIVHALSFDELTQTIRRRRHWQQAYIEHVEVLY